MLLLLSILSMWSSHFWWCFWNLCNAPVCLAGRRHLPAHLSSLLPIILGVCPKSPFSLCCSQIDVIYEVVEAKVVACGKKFYAHLSAYEVGCMCVAFMYLDFFPERIFKYGLSYSSFSCTLWLLHRSQVDVGGEEKGMRGRSSLALLKTSLLRIWLGYLFPTSEDERGWSGYFPYGFLRYCKNLDTG